MCINATLDKLLFQNIFDSNERETSLHLENQKITHIVRVREWTLQYSDSGADTRKDEPPQNFPILYNVSPIFHNVSPIFH